MLTKKKIYMEEEVIKVDILISEEGIIFIDNITSDVEALDECINNNSVLMYCESKEGYESMFARYKAYLIKSGANVKLIHKKLNFISFLYQNQHNLTKEAIGSVLKVIESASRLIGLSMSDTYKLIVERLNYLEK